MMYVDVFVDARYEMLFFFFKQKTAYEMRMSDWSSDVCSSDLLQAVLDTPLDGPGSPRLAALGGTQMRAEMEFFFVLEGASLTRLRTVCATLGEPDLIPASEQRLLGLMNGKIDLVFEHEGRYHVLDYKSNTLGDRIEHYCGDHLRAGMDKAAYRFQALLYRLGLGRFFQQSLANRT